MQSRYDFMEESVVLDKDGICFPDPLIDYNNGVLSKIPTLHRITNEDLKKFWVCMWENYQLNYYDDLWLNINGIPYLMELKPGDEIYKLAVEDLTNYITSKQLGSE
jgi:hypothetical protein